MPDSSMADSARSALDQALTRVGATAEEQLADLQECLALIDNALPHVTDDWSPTSEEEWWLALHRLQALQHLDRLHTSQALCKGAFHADVFASLRGADMATTAADFAMAGNLAAMHTLLELHPYCLLPAALGLLNSVPETVPPKAFGPSLRLLVALQSPPAVARPKDWIESEQMCIALRRRGEHRLLLCTEQMCKLNLGWAPPSESQVASWAQHRAVAVDKATGQLQWAVELLDVAKAALCYGPASQALGDIHRQAQALTLLLQLAAKRDGGEKWRTDLATFTALDTVDKLRLLFRYVDSGDDMASDIRRVVVPFASLLASDAQQQGSSETFIKALEAEADEQLPWVARFLQCEAERPEALGTAADVARAACAVTYASPSTEAWAFQEAILGATGEALASAPGVEPLQAESLRRAVDQARGHLTAARMLTRHGLPTPVATVRDATHEDAARLVRTLLARAARARTPESRWADLWTDLQVVLEQGLRAVPVDEARQELCRALLGCGQMRAAKKHLDRLPPEKQEEVVLTTARDLFYSEGAPDAAAVKRAKEALAVLPGNRAAEEEASFIDAAAKLKALGVDMPPLQLRQAPDKAMLLRQALESAPAKSLRDVDGLVALSGALGTGLSQDQVLALVAEVALAAAEVRLAEGVAMQLASKRSRHGWQVAARVALEETCSSQTIRRALLEFAMRFAPTDELDGQLHCWQASDAGAAGRPDVWSLPEPGELEEGYVHGAEAPLLEYLSQERIDAYAHGAMLDTEVLLLGCLLALGAPRQAAWARQLQERRGELDPGALRLGHVVGIVAAAITALAAGAVLPEDRGDDAEAPAEGIPQSLLSQSPRSLLMAGLAATSTNGSGNGAVTALGPLLQDLCQQLVAEADAQRVAQLLPGERNAGLWLEGDSDAQRKIVLQLAAAAGSGGAADHRSRKPLQAVSVHSGSDDELNSPRESSESDDWGHAENQPEASLSHALSLAERYSVDAWEVNLEYCIAVLQTAPGSRGISVDAQLAEGWPALLASNPRNALEGLVTRVLPVRSDAQRLALVLNLCAECCDAQTQDGVGTALRNLGLAVQGLADAAPGIDVHALLGPTLTALTAWAQCGKAVAASSPDEAQAAIAAAVDDLPSLQDVSQLARAIDALQLHQKELTDSISGANGAAKGPSIPAISGSTAFAAAACRELASMTMAEGVSEEARTSLDQCFCGMTAPDIAAVASFACFHGPPPLATAQGAASPSVLLSNEQSLAVVEAALRALPNAQGRETEGVLRAVPALETERARLTAFQRIAAVHHLTEPQSEALQAIVGKLLALAMEHSIDEALSLIGRQLAELLAAGCPVLLGIVPVGAALLPLAAGVEVTPADSTAVHAAVQGAADVAVDRAMLALAGDGDNAGLSVGDAVQSLYGILRSLDDTSPGEPGSEPFFPLSALRTHVWEQLERHVAARGQGDGAAAAAEAHLQVLEMLGLLGESMWGGWTPPAGALAASLKDSEALLHSRVAAALGPVWPGALQAASISAQDFASVEAAETALLRLIGVAEGAEQLQGVLNVLADVLSDAFMPQDASEASIHPLHSCWSACSAALLLRGVINPVLAALDAEHSVGSTIPVVTASEAVTLVEAADAAAGTIAAAAVGALMPYPDVRSAAWTRVLSLQATDDTQALPGALPLAVISLQQGQLPALAAQVPRVFKQLMSALLRCGAPAFCIEPIGGGARGAAGMPLRSALAAAAVAQLITAGERSAAGWLALEHSGVHPFLRTVNSAPPAVARLLRVATKAAGLAGVELEPAAANVVVTARCAEDVVQRVLKAAAEAERVWHGDTLS